MSRSNACSRPASGPIVLVSRRAGAAVADSVAPETRWLGLMLPYTPLHHLLLADFGGALVMTSGTVSDEPIAYDDGEARATARGIADAVLGHDRADPPPLRGFRRAARSSPSAGRAATRPARWRCQSRRRARPSQRARSSRARSASPAATRPSSRRISATSTAEPAYRAFLDDLELYLAMLGVRPEVIAHDLHPEYLSTKWALAAGRRARRRAASPCARGGLPCRARRDRAGAGARLRRHGLWHRRQPLGR